MWLPGQRKFEYDPASSWVAQAHRLEQMVTPTNEAPWQAFLLFFPVGKNMFQATSIRVASERSAVRTNARPITPDLVGMRRITNNGTIEQPDVS